MVLSFGLICACGLLVILARWCLVLRPMEDYYQAQGREWERYAMLKARILNPDPVHAVELNSAAETFCLSPLHRLLGAGIPTPDETADRAGKPPS